MNYNKLLESMGFYETDKLEKSKLNTLKDIKQNIENEIPIKEKRIQSLRDEIDRIRRVYAPERHGEVLSVSAKRSMEDELNSYEPEYHGLIQQQKSINKILKRANNLIKQKENEKKVQEKSLSRQVFKSLHSRVGPELSSIISSYGNVELNNNSVYRPSKKCKKNDTGCVISGGKTRRRKYNKNKSHNKSRNKSRNKSNNKL
jgi:hypothetical protein